MPIPAFHECFRPVLVALSAVPSLHMKVVQTTVESGFNLTPEELARKLPSGQFTTMQSRIGWARTYLFKAALIERVARGTYRINDAGRKFLAVHPDGISLAALREVPALQSWLAQSSVTKHADPLPAAEGASASIETPTESMDRNEALLRAEIADKLSEALTAMTPARFEWLVETLVVKLGYGSSAIEVRSALQRGGSDGGVDGVINEDRLGLGRIYLQAKRWKGTVGRPAIQSFVGAMHGLATKGVFITNSQYTKDARDYAESLTGIRIRLIDGRELAGLMIDTGLGVSEEQVYRTYSIDTDFFEEND